MPPTAATLPHSTLPAIGLRPLAVQAALLAAAALLLPALVHAVGGSGAVLLPMHWPVILAGLCYGWRSGLALGLAAPLASTALSGMPPAALLPAMSVELAGYGLLAGAAVELLRTNRFLATVLALLGGRLLFVAAAAATTPWPAEVADYARAAFVPGLWAAVAQLLVLPWLARWWVAREERPR